MKSKIFIIIVLLLFAALLVGAYLAYDTLFPVAKQIESPHPDTVLSFSVKDNSEKQYSIDINRFYDVILNSEPTRIMSVNDYPDTRPYYEVSISASDDRYYRYYLYSSNGKDYIEIPYFGVYEIRNLKIKDLFQ